MWVYWQCNLPTQYFHLFAFMQAHNLLRKQELITMPSWIPHPMLHLPSFQRWVHVPLQRVFCMEQSKLLQVLRFLCSIPCSSDHGTNRYLAIELLRLSLLIGVLYLVNTVDLYCTCNVYVNYRWSHARARSRASASATQRRRPPWWVMTSHQWRTRFKQGELNHVNRNVECMQSLTVEA